MNASELRSVATGLIPDRLFDILRTCERRTDLRFPATEVFNEGWMLRLLVDAYQQLAIGDHPLSFSSGASWYSEPRLGSPFRPRSRPDPLGEGFTHADAVLGHFEFHASTRAGLRLRPGARQFVVIEAKMFSDLSSGTTNARSYNQAARNVACMAEALAQADQPVGGFERLGFFVIAPEAKRRRPGQRLLDSAVQPEAIRTAVRSRVAAYGLAGRPETRELEIWERDVFTPLLERVTASGSVKVLTWEECIERVARADARRGAELLTFYERCLEFGAQELSAGQEM